MGPVATIHGRIIFTALGILCGFDFGLFLGYLRVGYLTYS